METTGQNTIQATQKKWWQDRSLWSLLITNLIVIFLIVKNNVPSSDVFLIFWIQSVIIGIFNVVRMLCLKNFSTENFYSNGKQVPANRKGKINAAIFFFIHYGIFHLSYFAFINTIFQSSNLYTGSFYIYSIIFFLNHLYSFIYNFDELTNGGNLGSIAISPYARIIPMHISIIFAGTAGQKAIYPLLFLKTAIDLFGHRLKHFKIGNRTITDQVELKNYSQPLGQLDRQTKAAIRDTILKMFKK